MTQRFGDDPQSIPGARIIAKGIIKTYAAGTHKADVQLVGSHPTIITAIRVATDIPAADVVVGRQCTVLFLDPANQDDAVILTIQGALPSGGGGGGTASDTVVSETTFGLTPAAGIATPYSRGDHTHGSPTDPVTAHVAAADPHTVYGALAQAETWAALQTFNAGLKLAAAQQIQDSGGTGRILLATASPHVKLTGDAQVTARLGVASAPAADRYLNVSPSGVTFSTTTYLAAINPASCTINTSTISVFGVYGAPAFNLSASITGVEIYGLSYLAMVGQGSGATVSTLRGLTAGWGALLYNGTVTDAAGIDITSPFVLGGTPTVTTSRGVYVRSQGHASIATALGIDVEAITAGTNRYGLRIGDMPGGTIARILELGPTPYVRLLGSGNWTPTANQTPLYLAEGATPTLRQLQWKAGNALVAGDKVLVLV